MKRFCLLMFAVSQALLLRGAQYKVTVAPYDANAISSLTLTNFIAKGTATYTSPQELTITGSTFDFLISLAVKRGYRDPHMSVNTYSNGSLQSTVVYASGARIKLTSSGTITDLTATLITNKVALDAQGGTVGSSYVMVPYGAAYSAASPVLPTPTRAGYTFNGWFTAASGGAEVTTATVENEVADHTLYAHWTANTYAVTFDAAGGTVSPEKKTVTYAAAYGELPTPIRTGYDFSAWTNAAGSAVTSSTIYQTAGDSVLGARWTAQTYTIHYHANFGTDVVTTSTFTSDTTTTLQTDSSRAGYTFGGWATTSSAGSGSYAGGMDVDVNALPFDADRTVELYAVWNPISYTVTLTANGGEGEDQTCARAWDDQKPLKADPAFARVGYMLKGWAKNRNTTEPEFEDGTTTNLTSSGDLILYAVWQPIAYSIVFSNATADVAGSMADVSNVVYDVATNLPSCTLTREGYDFNGWTNTAGTVYADGAVVSNLTSEADAQVVLYACWKTQTYVVDLDANGGSFIDTGSTTTSLVVSVFGAYDLPAVTNETPKLAFGGWRYRTPAGDWMDLPTAVPVKAAGVTNLVARWVKDDPIARALDAEELDFTADSAWCVVADADAEGGTCLAATISGIGTYWMTIKVPVVGPGALSFRWKVESSSKAWDSGYGFLEKMLFFVNGNSGSDFKYGLAAVPDRWGWSEDGHDWTDVSGSIGWTNLSHVVNADENTTNELSWSFYVFNDEFTTTIGTGYVDHVVWTPGAVRTATSGHTVPYAWLKTYYPEAATMTDDELEALAEKDSPVGKVGADGQTWKVWQDYWAGTDPTNAASLFRADITFTNSVPYVSWTPDVHAERGTSYRVLGALSLGGRWTTNAVPSSGDFRFFKVQIVLP